MSQMPRDFASAHLLVTDLPGEAPISPHAIPGSLRLFRDGALEAFYAPFDYENHAARVAIVGLTPGWQQAQIAYAYVAESRRRGVVADNHLRDAKRAASFAGAMRTNLTMMLNDLHLHESLGVQSCEALFDTAADLIHTTSALRYPVFKNSKNYSGSAPRPTQAPRGRTDSSSVPCSHRLFV